MDRIGEVMPGRSHKATRPLISLVLAAALMFAVLVLVLVQVFARYVGMSPTWTEEMIRWVWVWAACLGLGEVERGREHVSMNFLPAKLRPRARALLLLLFDLVALLVALDLVWLSYKSVRINWDTFASTMPISRGFLYLSCLVGSLLVLYHSIRHIVAWIFKDRVRSRRGMEVVGMGKD